MSEINVFVRIFGNSSAFSHDTLCPWTKLSNISESAWVNIQLPYTYTLIFILCRGGNKWSLEYIIDLVMAINMPGSLFPSHMSNKTIGWFQLVKLIPKGNKLGIT